MAGFFGNGGGGVREPATYMCSRKCGRYIDLANVKSVMPWGMFGGEVRIEFYCLCGGDLLVAGTYQFVPEFLHALLGEAQSLPFVNPVPQVPIEDNDPRLLRFRFYLDELPHPGADGPGGIQWPPVKHRE